MTKATVGRPAAIAEGVSQTFSSGFTALKNVSVAMESGRITALVGRNGSGKTTLLRLLAGILKPTSGTIQILNERVGLRSKSLRARLGYVSQSAELDPEMTGLETFLLFAALFGVPSAQRSSRIEELASDFGLTAFLRRSVAEYSGGLRQRLHLALGLIHDPELLLLDEPTAALDPAGRIFMWELLSRLRSRGRGIVVVTHDLAEAAEHCNHVVLLENGSVLTSGSPADLIAAHAAWNLVVEWTKPLEENSAIPAQIAALAGVAAIAITQNRAQIHLAENEPAGVNAAADRIFDYLAKLPVALVSFRLQAPDLANAYFNLTGGVIGERTATPRGGSGEGLWGGRRGPQRGPAK